MTRLAKTLITATATLTLLTASAYADSSNSGGTSNILNGQVNLTDQTATLQLNSTNIQGNVAGATVAGGNAIDITTMNNTNVLNNQYVSTGNIDADTYANLKNVGGTTDLASQSVCNSASISMDPTSTNVDSTQECKAIDPSATMHANITNANNDVSLASTAVSNTFEEDTNAPYGNVTNWQINKSAVNASTTGNLVNVNGNVTATASAIGNTGQIIHYSTGN
ncbi:MAG: hypothetical protein ACTHLR_15580 [Rhizomicrobium sp.]